MLSLVFVWSGGGGQVHCDAHIHAWLTEERADICICVFVFVYLCTVWSGGGGEQVHCDA